MPSYQTLGSVQRNIANTEAEVNKVLVQAQQLLGSGMKDHKSPTGVNFRNTPAVNTDASKRAEQLFAKVTNTMKAMEELKKETAFITPVPGLTPEDVKARYAELRAIESMILEEWQELDKLVDEFKGL